MQAGTVYPYRAVQHGPTVVVMPSPPPIICDRYAARSSIGLGIALMIIGMLCVIFNGVAFIAADDYVKFIGHGFWSAVMFGTTGSLGILAGKSKTRGSITGFSVMTILSACCSAALFGIAVAGAIYSRTFSRCNYYDYYYYNRSCMSSSDVGVALESMLAICAVAAGILSILGSVICCKSTCLCCGAPPVATAVMLPANYYPGVGQMMYISQIPSTNYIYPQQNLVASPPQQTSLGQTNWNQPQLMPPTENGFASQEPPPFDPPPSYSYSKP